MHLLGVRYGKVGSGLLEKMSVKNGSITRLLIVHGPDDKLRLLVSEGKSVRAASTI